MLPTPDPYTAAALFLVGFVGGLVLVGLGIYHTLSGRDRALAMRRGLISIALGALCAVAGLWMACVVLVS